MPKTVLYLLLYKFFYFVVCVPINENDFRVVL